MIYLNLTSSFVTDKGRKAKLVYGLPSSSGNYTPPVPVTYLGPPDTIRNSRDMREIVVDLWGCKLSDQAFKAVNESVRGQIAKHIAAGYVTATKAGVALTANQVLTGDFRIPLTWLDETIPLWLAPPATKTYQGDFVSAHNATPKPEDPISENMGPELLKNLTIQIDTIANCTVTLWGTTVPYANTGDASWPWETTGSDMPGIGYTRWIDVTTALIGAATIVAPGIFDLTNAVDSLYRLHNFRIKREYVPAGGTCHVTVLV